LFWLFYIFGNVAAVHSLQSLSGRQKRAESPGEDYSTAPDVIYVIQRAGVTNSDFAYVKKFIGLAVHSLTSISPGKANSRLAITIFTALAQHPIDYTNCCRGGRSGLQRKINEVSMYSEVVIRKLDRGDHSDLDPNTIDVGYALRAIRSKYLRRNAAKLKPTLIVLVVNFQAPYASFRLLLDAMDEVKACKEEGAWLVTIIVDPMENRQPRLKIKIATRSHIPDESR
uniref:VWFA domain-containing protein n=3 Tax=Ciona intestinalis TaxID=7719 RepID=F6SXX0_CIOIN